jgi:hypothetical protein
MGPGGEGWGPGVTPGSFRLSIRIPVMTFLQDTAVLVPYNQESYYQINYHAMPDGVTGRVAGVLCTSIA